MLQVEIIFPKRILAIKEAVAACLKGKDSIQCENIQMIAQIHSYPLDGGMHLPDITI